MEQIFLLSHNGQERFKGTENGCYFELQRRQSQSADWAIKWDRWKIEPLEGLTPEQVEEILKADPWHYLPATLVKDFPGFFGSPDRIRVKLADGSEVFADPNATRRLTPISKAGDTIEVMQGRLTKGSAEFFESLGLHRTQTKEEKIKNALLACVDFIENVTDDDPQRQDKFFAVRELWREALHK